MKYKNEVTDKEKTILLLIYIFRFLDRKQIQEFLNHKDYRRINAWLKELTDREYLERDFRPVYGKITKPALYFLAIKGRKYIREAYPYSFPKYLRRISRDKKTSRAFRIRCQIVADYYLAFFPTKISKNRRQTTGILIVDCLIYRLKTGKGKRPVLNEFNFLTPSLFPESVFIEKLKPDAAVEMGDKRKVVFGLIFILDAYIPKFPLKYTLKHIFDLLIDLDWDKELKYTLYFSFICPNNKIVIYLRRLIPSFFKNYYEDKEIVFRIATRNQLYAKKNGKTEDIKWVIFSSDDDY